MNSSMFTSGMRYSVLAIAGLMASGAYAQTISKMKVVSTYQRPSTVNSSGGVWGWTSPVTGKEYALMTIQEPGGLCVIDISDPTKPTLNTFIEAGHNSLWFEVNAYRNFAYMVSEEGSIGLKIIDLSPLNTGLQAKLVTNNTQFFTRAHTLYVDSTVSPPRLYATYGGAQGVQILSLADPAKPVNMGKMGGETHDMYAKGDLMFRATQRRGTLEIWNVATPSAPLRLSTTDLTLKSRELGELPANGTTITHNSWTSEDGKTLFTSEETEGTSVKSWDITDPAKPKYMSKYIGVKDVIAHNIYVHGNKLYVAHYTGGLRIVDISDPRNMKELAYHRPSISTELYAGTWGAYPWFKSGYIIHGDMQLGLFVMKDESPPVTSLRAGSSDSRFTIAGMHNGALRFRLPLAGNYALSFFTPAGREVFSHRAPGGSGLQTLAIGNGRLGNGEYLVRLRQDSRSFSSRIVLGD
jgi:choice-of-anchor B domain-containing protein